MKKCLFLLLFLALSGFFSCGKLCGCTIPNEPTLSGRINNIVWEPAITDTVKNDSISIWGKRSWDELKLKFAINPASIETDVLVSGYDATYTSNPKSEKGRLIYRLDNTAANKIKISYLQSENFLSGQFNLTLKLTTPTGNLVFDTTRIYFTNARFRARLRK